ncbi:protein of unknown function [Paenibacillaceae bacterium GAS479]|nr:protein of unknown function [Paenibacillaceae bacterium GAS479]
MDRHPVWTEWQKASQYSMLAGYYRELDPVISLSYATLHQEAMQRLAVLVHMYGYPPEYPTSGPSAYDESAFLGSSFFPTADSFPLPGLEPDSQWVQYGPPAGASWPVSTGPLAPSSWQPIQNLPGLAPTAQPSGYGAAAPGMTPPVMGWPQAQSFPWPAPGLPWQSLNSPVSPDYGAATGFVPVSSTDAASTGFVPMHSTDAAATGFIPVSSTDAAANGFVPVSSSNIAASDTLPFASTDAASYDFFPVTSTGSGASFQSALGRDKNKAEANKSKAASTFIRLLHAAPGQPELELRLEGAYDSLTAAYLKASPYVQAHHGVHRVQLFPENSALAEAAKTDAETAFELDLEAGIRYTVAVTADPQEGLQLLLFSDELESQEDRTKVRLIHLATGGPVDVMVRNGGTLFRNVASGSASPYITLSPAQLSLDLTEAGSLRLLHACEPLQLPAASAGTLLYGGTPPKLHLILDS